MIEWTEWGRLEATTDWLTDWQTDGVIGNLLTGTGWKLPSDWNWLTEVTGGLSDWEVRCVWLAGGWRVTGEWLREPDKLEVTGELRLTGKWLE